MSKLRTFWSWEVETQKITITMTFVLIYKMVVWHMHTTSIILQQSGTIRCVYYAENCQALVQHVEIKDKTSRIIFAVNKKAFFVKN